MATIGNDATLSYAYGAGKPFRAKSDPVQITVLKPQAAGKAVTAEATIASKAMAAGTGSRLAAARTGNESARSKAAEASAAAKMNQRAQNSRIIAKDGHSKMQQSAASASSTSADMAGFTKDRSARGSHAAADARASQTSRSEAASGNYRVASSSSSAIIRKSSLSATNYAGTGKTEAYCSRLADAFAATTVSVRRAQARSDWSAKCPKIRKWVTKDRVVVNQRFEYVVEILNNTGLDLALAEVGDQLDARLSVNPATVRVYPRVRNSVVLTNRLLNVKFPKGIHRGDAIRIAIPVVVTSGSDE